MAKLNRPDTPLFAQIRGILAHDIESGAFEPSNLLPSEKELCERFGVSRITVRKAVSELADMGLVRKRQGLGTFATPRRYQSSLISLGGFTDGLSVSRGTPRRKILEKSEITADTRIAEQLGIEPGAPVLHLVRLLSDDTLPLTIDVTHYPLDHYPGFGDRIDTQSSTYQILREDYGVQFAEARRLLSVVYADEFQSEHLQCHPAEPLILIWKVIIDTGGRPVHTSRLYTVPDRVQLSVVTPA